MRTRALRVVLLARIGPVGLLGSIGLMGSAGLLACDETAPADPPGADAPAAAPSEPAPATAAADAPAQPETPEPEPVPGVVLTNPGRNASAALTYTPKAGRSKPIVIELRVNTREGEEPAPLSPRVRIAGVTMLSKDQKAGFERSTFRVDALEVLHEEKVDDEAEKALLESIGDLDDREGVYERNVLGTTTTMVLTGAMEGDPTRAKLASALRHAWNNFTVAVPNAPVGVGATWTVTRPVDLHGIEAWEIATFTLDKIELPQVEIYGDVVYRLVEGGQHAPIGYTGITKVTHLEATGKYEGRLDLDQGAPVESHFGVSAAFTGLTSDGSSMGGKFGLDVRVDEDYLATPDPRLTLKGRFTQGGLVYGKLPAGTKVWFQKKRVQVSPEGDFLVGLDYDSPERVLFSFALPDGPVERHVIQVERREFPEERIDGLPTELVDPDAETRKALNKAQKLIEKVRSRATRTVYFANGFKMPVKGRITSTFGRERILNGEKKGRHWGLDIAAPVGKKIKAPAPGVVVFAAPDVPLAGTTLILDHGHGLTSSFLHLADIKVKEGDEVKAGQVIATVGNTGRTTGPHLDWRMNLFDTRVDPQLALAWKKR